MIDREEHKTLVAVRGLIAIARSNWPSSNGDLDLSLGGSGNVGTVTVPCDLVEKLLEGVLDDDS